MSQQVLNQGHVLKPRQREGAVHGSVIEAAEGAPAGFTEWRPQPNRGLPPGAPEQQAIYAPRRGCAGVAAITSMGGHFCIRELELMSPLPMLNAIPEVNAEIRRRNLKTVGILGTRIVMETRL